MILGNNIFYLLRGNILSDCISLLPNKLVYEASPKRNNAPPRKKKLNILEHQDSASCRLLSNPKNSSILKHYSAKP